MATTDFVVKNGLVVTDEAQILGTTDATSATDTAAAVYTAGGVAIAKKAFVGTDLAVVGNTVLTGDIAVNGGDITTNQVTFNLVNNTAATVNFAGAATDIQIGAATGTVNINNNLDVDGDVNIDGGDLTVSTAAFNLANTTATTVNAFGAAATLTLGATTGTTTIRTPTVTLSNATAVNVNGASPTFASTSTGTLTLFNTNLTTATAFGAATTVNIGNATAAQTVNIGTASTGASTYNFATAPTATATIKTVNIGTAGASGSTTNVNIGSAIAGVTTVNSATLVGSVVTQNVFNTLATTVNAFGAAGTIAIGANSGTITIGNPTLVGTQATQNVYNTVATTVNAFGAGTDVTIGATTGTTTIRNASTVISGAVTLSSGTANGVAFLNASKVLTTGSALTFDGTNTFGVTSSGNAVFTATTTSTTGAFSRYTNGTADHYIGLNNTSGSLFGGVGGASGLGIVTYGNLPIGFGINGSEQMRLTSVGLGIGVSSATARLHVFTAAASIDQVFINAGVNGTGKGLVITTNTRTISEAGVAALEVISRTNTSTLVATVGGDVGIGTSSPSSRLTVNGEISVIDNFALRLGSNQAGGATILYNGNGNLDITPRSGYSTVFTAGNVGIGTSSPAVRLHLQSAGSISGYNEIARIESTALNSGSKLTFFGKQGSDASTKLSGAIGFNQTINADSNGQPAFIIETGNNGSITEKMRIDTAGNVRVVSGLQQGPDMTRPLSQWSATSATGMVYFEFPGNTTNYGMVHAVIDIYEYDGNTVSTVIVGGHNWQGGWYNVGANVVGQTNKQVRLGVRGGKYVICIGSAGSTWAYGTVVLRKIHNGGFYSGIINMSAEFVANITTNESLSFDTGDLRALRTPASFNAGGAITQAGNQVLHAGNFTSYAPSLTGGGASGTWGINITGNAGTATVLQTARNINGVSFNGSADITVSDATKLPLAGGTLTGRLISRQAGVSLASSNSSQLEINNAANGACNISFHREGAYGAHFGLDTDNVFSTLGWSAGAGFTAMRVGNFTANGTIVSVGTVTAPTFIGALSGNAATATNLSTVRSNWSTNGTITAVVGQLAWKNYGNSHTIFDASAGTSPDGGAVNNTNAAIAWAGSYPTLMGWNGSQTYGVRVDSARVADSVIETDTLASVTGRGASTSTRVTLSGGATITSADIRSAATSTWTGDPGAEGKIQYHSNRWYVVADQSSDRIVQFRRNSTDVSHIDNSGVYHGNVSGNITGNAATAATASNLISAAGVIQTTTSGTSYANAIQVREASGGSGNGNTAFMPRLGFHWSGIVASSIGVEASGRIAIFNNPGNGYEALVCAALTATSGTFSGSGIFSGNVGAGVTPDTRLSVNGDAHISSYLYMGGTAGAVGSWSSRLLSSGGATTLSTSTFAVNRDGYGGGGSMSFNTSGLTIVGTLTATTKSFLIDHPTRPGMKLRYGSLEGPENGVYVRGKLVDSTVIELPDYWTGLVDADSITVNLTAAAAGQQLYVDRVENNCVYIVNETGQPVTCFYTVYGERKDVDKLQVEIE